MWRFKQTIFRIELTDEAGWTAGNNSVPIPVRRKLDESLLNEGHLARVRNKAEKAPRYAWAGPLILLVRNPYQPFTPSRGTADAVRENASGVFDEVWLVNRAEGVDDLRPPQPRLVRVS